MSVKILPVRDRRALWQFIDLPPVLYAGFSGFEPPMRMDRALLLDPRKSAFCKRGVVQYWIALRDGVPVGRISAQIAEHPALGMPEGTGLFGCLDVIDDREVVAALIDVAEAWLRERGCRHVSGPHLLDMNGEPGLMVGGFDLPPMTATGWHPPYLQSHLEAMGYAKWKDLHYWGIDLRKTDHAALRQSLRLDRRRLRVTARPITRRSLAAELPLMRDLFNDGWSDNWGHVPLTLDDMQGLLLLRPFLPPQAGRVFELDGAPVAIWIAIPNMFELTRGVGPRPSPLGWLKLAWRAIRFRPRSGLMVLFGISRRLRFSIASAEVILKLVDELIEVHLAVGYDWVEAGWALEDNTALTKLLTRYNFEIRRTYRVFGKCLSVR